MLINDIIRSINNLAYITTAFIALSIGKKRQKFITIFENRGV